ncbi:MAG: ubiquitin-like protein UBact [Candidatus Poribacteria bacterium]|nr:ubiquitin-like protein UBact [Candidatus Poribacteria bacterium]
MTVQHFTFLRDRIQRPVKPVEPGDGDDDGPRRPEVTKPDTKNLIRRMRRVDKDQSRRYRQRTGE